MNIKKFLAIGVAVAALVITMALPAAAAPGEPPLRLGAHVNASQCNTNGSPVLNISYKVLHDADWDVTGSYVWAFDNYDKKVKVWAQSDGTFCAETKFVGRFVSLAGDSPNHVTTGGTVGAGVTGTFEWGYIGHFDGTFQPRQQPDAGLYRNP